MLYFNTNILNVKVEAQTKETELNRYTTTTTKFKFFIILILGLCNRLPNLISIWKARAVGSSSWGRERHTWKQHFWRQEIARKASKLDSLYNRKGMVFALSTYCNKCWMGQPTTRLPLHMRPAPQGCSSPPQPHEPPPSPP